MLISKPRFPVREILLYGFLPSPIKTFVYRLKGYKIGASVSIGFGSVICGEDVEIKDHTQIGFASFIQGKRIRLGAHVSIGSLVMMDTPDLEIGDGTKINEQVFVGGLQYPHSKLRIGRNCQIMQMTFINPTHTITIGDDTGIGGDSLIFGHTSWLSKFEGYPTEFRSIEIGNSVSVAWRVFITAGAKIGDGSVIGANSLVNRSIPSKCLAVGSPAKVFAKAPYYPREVTDAEKHTYFHEIVDDMLQFMAGSGLPCHRNDSEITITQITRRWGTQKQTQWNLTIAEEPVASLNGLRSDLHAFLSLCQLPDEIRRKLSERRVAWIDIESKERSDFGNDLAEEVVLYFRRYGVRLIRIK
jgi:acetyltransferase-like isoleucine patch superfamily enzyme